MCACLSVHPAHPLVINLSTTNCFPSDPPQLPPSPSPLPAVSNLAPSSAALRPEAYTRRILVDFHCRDGRIVRTHLALVRGSNRFGHAMVDPASNSIEPNPLIHLCPTHNPMSDMCSFYRAYTPTAEEYSIEPAYNAMDCITSTLSKAFHSFQLLQNIALCPHMITLTLMSVKSPDFYSSATPTCHPALDLCATQQSRKSPPSATTSPWSPPPYPTLVFSPSLSRDRRRLLLDGS